ncbi:MAG: sugar phosphate isomerase/epimerase [Kiritimatiellaeota bacterium]|nr:sugar phosphate isomerase/epimerase [Kiritimatiellota bacterium]
MRKLMAVLVLAATVTAEAGRKDWKIGLQCWTFNGKSLVSTIDYCAQNGIQHLEIYPGQKIGEGFAGKSGHTMSVEECGKLQAILKQKGVSLLSYGVVRAGNEKEWREIFDFAKRMGLQTIIAEPGQNQMEMLDKLTEEYGVKVGIHNHGEPTPDQVAKLLAGRSSRIGIAPDNGHWSRRGFDNLESLKRFEGRILSIHLKDLNAAKRDVPYGAGTVPVAGILAYLDQADYKGPIIIEYESGNQEAEVRKCTGYLKAFIETGKR